MSEMSKSTASAKARTTRESPPPLDIYHPISTLKAVLLHPGYVDFMQSILLCGEICLCAAIIYKIKFTNIDWVAYMEQVDTVIKGERDYIKIRGDSGPLVYPAGFVWIFSLFYYLTDRGTNIHRAQSIFAGLYILTLAVVFRIYKYDRKIPPFAYALLTLSKRLHSLYILRCFNDGVAMFILYCAIWSLCRRQYKTSSVLFSVALSVKMNIILFLPGLGLVWLASVGLSQTLNLALLMVAVQISTALPFLTHDWQSYLSRAFDFGRIFFYEWTVNWRFLSERIFLSRNFARTLLVGHAATLVVAASCWCKPFGGIYSTLRKAVQYPDRAVAGSLSPRYIMTVLFTCNLIGMLFARSIHYQFYIWEAHQLVYLVWQTRMYLFSKIAILGAIELGYETFPSTSLSSASLVTVHAVLVALLLYRIDWRRL